MNFSDERYVKVYTRDTADVVAIGWEGRALFWELLRKSDRAGVVDVAPDDVDLIAAMTGIPVDVAKVGLERIVRRGIVQKTEHALVIRNWDQAQEVQRSDAARQRELRAKRRDKALANGLDPKEAIRASRPDRYKEPVDNLGSSGGPSVTHAGAWSADGPIGHAGSHGGHDGSANDSTGHENGHVGHVGHEMGHSVPSRSVPYLPYPSEPPALRDPPPVAEPPGWVTEGSTRVVEPRRVPPRYVNGTGGYVPGSIAERPQKCTLCGAGPPLVDEPPNRLCFKCRFNGAGHA